MRFSNKFLTLCLFSFSACFLVPQNVCAQEADTLVTPRITAPIIVNSSEIKDVKLWGFYQELSEGPMLSSDLWKNSNSANLKFAFTKITGDQKFIPLLSLSKRAIFSGGIGPDNDDESLGILRFNAALNVGDIAQANQLIGELSDVTSNESLAISYADNLLYENRIEDACQIVSILKTNAPNKKLLELRAACFALHNEGAAANLSLEVAASLNNKKNDDWLYRSINYVGAMNGDNAPSFARDFDFNGDNGVNYALSNRAKAKLNTNIPRRALERYMIDNGIGETKTALNAARFGIGEYGDLKKFFVKKNNVENTSNVISDAVIAVDNPNVAIEDFLKNATDFNEFYGLSKSISNEISQIKETNIDNAKTFAAAALINKNKDSFSRFMAIDFDNNAAFKLVGSIEFGDKFDYDLPARLKIAKNQNEINLALGDALIANALGANIGMEDFWRGNFGTKTPASQTILFTLDDATKRGAKGEVALLAHLAMQGQNPNSVDILSIVRVIANLNQAGFNQEAKDLAVFTILARNLEFAQPFPTPAPIAKSISSSLPKIISKSAPSSAPKVKNID